jgi:uncharacterized membrane protein (UPF0127 family)
MDKKETRGRPIKYNYPMKQGEQMEFYISNQAKKVALQVSAYQYAKRHGLKYRTWMVNDTKMVVECQSLAKSE